MPSPIIHPIKDTESRCTMLGRRQSRRSVGRRAVESGMDAFGHTRQHCCWSFEDQGSQGQRCSRVPDNFDSRDKTVVSHPLERGARSRRVSEHVRSRRSETMMPLTCLGLAVRSTLRKRLCHHADRPLANELQVARSDEHEGSITPESTDTTQAQRSKCSS